MRATTPGFLMMSTYMNFFEPHDLRKTDDELIERYCEVTRIKKVHKPWLLVKALRLCIRVNLCGHLCN